MPSITTMASWVFIVVCVFVAWVTLGLVVAMLWSWHRRRYGRRDANEFERRWREDDGDDP